MAQASYATHLSAMAHTFCAVCRGAVKTCPPAAGYALVRLQQPSGLKTHSGAKFSRCTCEWRQCDAAGRNRATLLWICGGLRSSPRTERGYIMHVYAREVASFGQRPRHCRWWKVFAGKIIQKAAG